LNLEVTAADEEKVVHRLKAGRDLNLQEKIGEGEGAEKDGEEWGLWGFGNNHQKKHHKTLRSAAKDSTNQSKIFALNAKPKGTRKKRWREQGDGPYPRTEHACRATDFRSAEGRINREG
jgi:hypothetical protein